MKPAYTPGTLTVPPRRVAAMHWRRALPLEPSSLSVAITVSTVLPLASKPIASMLASAPRPPVSSMMRSAGSSISSKLIVSQP